MGVAWTIHNAIVPPKSDYEKLKRKINRTTFAYGTALTSTYFITQGAPEGVSAALGVATSLSYISLLQNHVDNIENHHFKSSCWHQLELLYLKQCGIMHLLVLILTM